MTEIFWNTITEDARLVLTHFSRSAIARSFYLAGGTALAMQLGHRHSVDLDFFSTHEDILTIRTELENSLSTFPTLLADSSWGNLVYLVKNVRVGFYRYRFPLVAPLIKIDGMRLASIEDIALMKLDALISRAAQKDFFDLYFICKNISLEQLFKLSTQKYPSVRDFESQVAKRLVYFENAENESDPSLLENVPWQTVKEYFIKRAKEIGQSWLQ
ncbi:MAG: nucleotidyl transferase AbiEii/AbiGii toxin family protein [Chloroflexi bacterium]|nr:nucleotidyl transferase AbiEii/AbiGii toxin family protein [Chloroflexota bacterium]